MASCDVFTSYESNMFSCFPFSFQFLFHFKSSFCCNTRPSPIESINNCNAMRCSDQRYGAKVFHVQVHFMFMVRCVETESTRQDRQDMV